MKRKRKAKMIGTNIRMFTTIVCCIFKKERGFIPYIVVRECAYDGENEEDFAKLNQHYI
jgi:hypothetical protein